MFLKAPMTETAETSAAVDAPAAVPAEECNLCGSTEFTAMKSRLRARCAGCGSLERTRLFWMYIERLPITPDTRVLHIAPESQIYRRLNTWLTPGNYVTADIAPEPFRRFAPDTRYIDLCDLDGWESDQFDLILHSHVLEHTPCNIAYSLFHLHRMLRPTGRHVCIIPFMPGDWDESFAEIGDDQRKRRFGQHDHVRRYGTNQIDAHLGKLLRLPDSFDATRDFPREVLRRANIPENQAQGFGIATVLNLGKYDMLMLGRS